MSEDKKYKAKKEDDPERKVRQNVKVFFKRSDRISIEGVFFKITKIKRNKIELAIEGESLIQEGEPIKS
jgi:hypothetical protein